MTNMMSYSRSHGLLFPKATWALGLHFSACVQTCCEEYELPSQSDVEARTQTSSGLSPPPWSLVWSRELKTYSL